MYSVLYLIYVAISTVLGLFAFYWALKNGQFSDQQRARYLPLEDAGKEPVASGSRFNRYQAYGLFAFLSCGLLASAALVIYAIIRTR